MILEINELELSISLKALLVHTFIPVLTLARVLSSVYEVVDDVWNKLNIKIPKSIEFNCGNLSIKQVVNERRMYITTDIEFKSLRKPIIVPITLFYTTLNPLMFIPDLLVELPDVKLHDLTFTDLINNVLMNLDTCKICGGDYGEGVEKYLNILKFFSSTYRVLSSEDVDNLLKNIESKVSKVTDVSYTIKQGREYVDEFNTYTFFILHSIRFSYSDNKLFKKVKPPFHITPLPKFILSNVFNIPQNRFSIIAINLEDSTTIDVKYFNYGIPLHYHHVLNKLMKFLQGKQFKQYLTTCVKTLLALEIANLQI